MFNWLRIFCGLPHIARNLMRCFILSLNVLLTMQRHRLQACWKIYLLALTEHKLITEVKVFSCFDVPLLGQFLLPSLRGW